MKIYKLKIVVGILLLSLTVQSYAFDSGSTGADGAFAPTANTSVSIPANGILNYTTFNIPSGVTVKFTRNTANTPVYILVQGDAVIDGVLDVNGLNGNTIGFGAPGGFDGGQPQAGRGETGQGPGGSRGSTTGTGGNGGSYGATGFAGSNNFSGTNPIGPVYGSITLQPLLGGSGGGATANPSTTVGGGRGGSGGGAVLLAVSGTLTLNGEIQAQGGNGGVSENNVLGAGGGSGGAVRLIATTLAGSGLVNISGGLGRIANTSGGNGGTGRARLEADSFSFTGNVVPNIFETSAPREIFAANLPTVAITAVGGTSVPANPTGENDVILPTSISNPVTIELSATDVPLDSIIEVTLASNSSSGQETVSSSALTGTVASSTATAQVSLPQGSSTLFASVSFTVSGSTASLYTPYTNGELVAKVELRSTFGAGSEMLLTTESGNVYRVKS